MVACAQLAGLVVQQTGSSVTSMTTFTWHILGRLLPDRNRRSNVHYHESTTSSTTTEPDQSNQSGHTDERLSPNEMATEASGSESYLDSKRRLRIDDFLEAKKRKEKWVALTSYDAISAKIFDQAQIPCLIVGDSAAQAVYGYDSTLAVTLDEMIPLARAVSSSCRRALVVGDLPFGSYQESPEKALQSSVRYMKEAHVHAVKLEGGAEYSEHVKLLVRSGIPVMGHIGLTPQSVNLLSGFKVQGRGELGVQKLINDGKALQAAGVFAIVLELVPTATAKLVTEALKVPVIGIGAGSHCDAQVLVWQDMAGFVFLDSKAKGPERYLGEQQTSPESNGASSALKLAKCPKFVKMYANFSESLFHAARKFAEEVEKGAYPAEEHSYT